MGEHELAKGMTDHVLDRMGYKDPAYDAQVKAQ